MITPEGWSLYLELGQSPETVRLRSSTSHEDAFRRLVPRFRTVSQRDSVTADVGVDDFLSNLVELASWPSPESVQWDPVLARLVTDSASDARRAEAHLGSADDVEPTPPQMPGEWIAPLTNFQQRDLAHLLSLRHGANFSVPGAGKTRVALALYAILRARGEVGRMLVIAPKSAYEAWQQELAECFSDVPRAEILGRSAGLRTEVLIVNYERLEGLLPELTRWVSSSETLVVLDEAHRMKLGSEGKYGAACLALGPRAARRLIMTGTPAPNGSRDLENLFGFVWPGQGRTTVTRAVAGGDLRRASAVLRPLFTRTTKDELGLPEVTTAIRRVDLPPLHREIYNALVSQFTRRAELSRDDFDALGKITIYLLMAATTPALLAVGTTKYEPLSYQVPPLTLPEGSGLLELMRDLPSYEMSPKYQEVLAIVDSNARLGKKTIVWSTFVRSLTTLTGILREYSPALVFGGTLERDEEIRRFRFDADCMVLLTNPATLGEGVSLHHQCHDAVYVDRDFAAGRYLQSLDRIHRLGLAPTTETNITVLASTGTIDEVVEARLRLKLDFMGKILDDPAVERLADLDEEPTVGAGLTSDDLQALMGHLHAVDT